MGELGLGLGSQVQFGLGARARQSFCLMNYGRSSITRFLCSARRARRLALSVVCLSGAHLSSARRPASSLAEMWAAKFQKFMSRRSPDRSSQERPPTAQKTASKTASKTATKTATKAKTKTNGQASTRFLSRRRAAQLRASRVASRVSARRTINSAQSARVCIDELAIALVTAPDILARSLSGAPSSPQSVPRQVAATNRARP